MNPFLIFQLEASLSRYDQDQEYEVEISLEAHLIFANNNLVFEMTSERQKSYVKMASQTG